MRFAFALFMLGCVLGCRTTDRAAPWGAPVFTASAADAQPAAREAGANPLTERAGNVEQVLQKMRVAGGGRLVSMPFPSEWPWDGKRVILIEYGGPPLSTGRVAYRLSVEKVITVALEGDALAEVDPTSAKYGKPTEYRHSRVSGDPGSSQGPPRRPPLQGYRRPGVEPCPRAVRAVRGVGIPLRQVVENKVQGFVAWLEHRGDAS